MWTGCLDLNLLNSLNQTKNIMRDLMLIVHFIGLAMALGTGFANMFLGSAAAKTEPAERGPFMSKTMVLVRMGQIGLGLLLISGFYMITPYWGSLMEMPLLMAKLGLVLAIAILVTVISLRVKKSQKEGNPALLMTIKPLGMANFFIAITVVILAVLIFH